jgi:hypothetical protein
MSACTSAGPRRSRSWRRRRRAPPCSWYSAPMTPRARSHGSTRASTTSSRRAARKSITLIWLGPPCVRQSWDTRARDLDQMLSARLENTDVRMRDAELCAGNLQEPDGVHLKTKGYVHMWEKAAAAAGFAVEQTPRRIADPAARAAAAAALGCLGFCARARPARAATVGAARRRHYGLDPPRPTR